MSDQKPTLSSYMTHMLSQGHVVFSHEDAQKALGVSRGAFLDAAERRQSRNHLVRPRNGFYVIVPPQYLAWGAPPPSWYIDSLMCYEGCQYYVGLLKAAELHGATHHAVIECFLFYMKKSGISISRSEAEQRMLAKVDSSRLLNDVRPLLPESEIEYLTDSTAKAIFLDVFNNFIGRIPGKPWAKTEEKLERLGFVSE